MTMHSFDIDEAIKHGIDKAVIIANLRFWLAKNKANNKNFHDGYYWTYNSSSAFVELFPYFSQSKIKRLLKELESDGFILTGNYNKSSYDRTKWYSMPEFCIAQNESIHCPKLDNGKHENEPPIPDSKPVNKTDDIAASEKLNYSEIESAYNELLPKASNIAKLTPTRKKLIKQFFADFDLNIEKFKNYLMFLDSNKDCQWLFESRPMNDGSGRRWKPKGLEYFLSEKCYLDAKELIINE